MGKSVFQVGAGVERGARGSLLVLEFTRALLATAFDDKHGLLHVELESGQKPALTEQWCHKWDTRGQIYGRTQFHPRMRNLFPHTWR